MGFFIHTEMAGNVEKLVSIIERVAVVVVQLNKGYRLKIVQLYAPTAKYDEEAVDCLYEDIESAIKKGTTRFTFVVGDFITKVGEKQVGEKSAGNSGVGIRNSGGDTLVVLAERNNAKAMNTFFCERKNTGS